MHAKAWTRPTVQQQVDCAVAREPLFCVTLGASVPCLVLLQLGGSDGCSHHTRAMHKCCRCSTQRHLHVGRGEPVPLHGRIGDAASLPRGWALASVLAFALEESLCVRTDGRFISGPWFRPSTGREPRNSESFSHFQSRDCWWSCPYAVRAFGLSVITCWVWKKVTVRFPLRCPINHKNLLHNIFSADS